jgi:midasin
MTSAQQPSLLSISLLLQPQPQRPATAVHQTSKVHLLELGFMVGVRISSTMACYADVAAALVAELPEAAQSVALRAALSLSTADPARSCQAILDLAAIMLLQPSATLAVARALRPLILDILARALQQVRSGHVGAVESNETAFVVLAKLCSVAAHTLPLALHHWRCTPCPFTLSLVQQECSPERLHAVIEAAHHLLQHHTHTVLYLWNWAPFFKLCNHSSVLIRWRAVCIMSIVLSLSEADKQSLLQRTGVLSQHSATLPTEVVDANDEHERCLAREREAAYSSKQHRLTVDDSLAVHPYVMVLGGIVHIKADLCSSAAHYQQSAAAAVAATHRPLVRCSSTLRNLSAFSLALTQPGPVLLIGAAGSGKSSLLREAARLACSGAAPLLELHLDDQTDSRTLLGAYVCTDVPGEFTWQPGALTIAVTRGQWVLIEDIDRAPFEILAALTPLLEGGVLIVPGWSKPLRAAAGFRLFGTVTASSATTTTVQLGGSANFGALWTQVVIEPLTPQELLTVAIHTNQGLPPRAAAKMLDTFHLLRGERTISSSSSSSSSSSTVAAVVGTASGRVPSVRDFLTFAGRVHKLGAFEGALIESQLQPVEEGTPVCTELQALAVLSEALDVFAAYLRSVDALTLAAEELATLWNVRPETAITLAISKRPQLVIAGDTLAIGRVSLKRRFDRADAFAAPSDFTQFAPTGQALRLMERLAVCITMQEPVLLVGETGCGKTTLVQQLAKYTGQKLIVQNLSLQTDSADLLGGYRPVELRQLAQVSYLEVCHADTYIL